VAKAAEGRAVAKVEAKAKAGRAEAVPEAQEEPARAKVVVVVAVKVAASAGRCSRVG